MDWRPVARRWLLGSLAALAPAVAGAEPDAFYAGKTITIVTSGGGAYEAYARALARHMPGHISGRPNIIVQVMPGAGGVRAASYVYKVAPRDGTVIAGTHGAVLTSSFMNLGAVDYDATRFS